MEAAIANFLHGLSAMRSLQWEEVANRARSVGSTCSCGRQIQGLCVGADIEELILCHRDAHLRARCHEGDAAGGGGGIQGWVGGICMASVRTPVRASMGRRA